MTGPKPVRSASFSKIMRFPATILLLATAVGCSTGGFRDDRLTGTWRSNREQTIDKMFQRDPRWANASPERVQKLRAMFGQMTITYGHKAIVTHFNGENERLGYKVVERGSDYVVILIKGGMEDGQKRRLHFVDDAQAYWIQSFMVPSIEERFDKVNSEPGVAASGSQPSPPAANSTPSAVGARRSP